MNLFLDFSLASRNNYERLRRNYLGGMDIGMLLRRYRTLITNFPLANYRYFIGCYELSRLSLAVSRVTMKDSIPLEVWVKWGR